MYSTNTRCGPAGRPSFALEKHVKQNFLVDTYHNKFNHEFRKNQAISQIINGHVMRWDISKMFLSFDEWKSWSSGNRKSFQLGFVRQNLSSSVDTSKVQALAPVFWSQMCDCVVDYETAMYQVMNNWNRKIYLVIDGERQKLRNISNSGRMCLCSYLWKFSCFHSHCCQRTWRLVLWRLACCSQSTIAKGQQPIVTSHCLHVP